MGHGLDCLGKEHFDDKIIGLIAENIKEFYVKNQQIPSKEALVFELKKIKLADEVREYFWTCVDAIYEKVGVNGEYYRSKAEEFVHSKKIKKTLQKSMEILESGDLEGAISQMQQNVNHNGSLLGGVYNFFSTLGERAREYFEGDSAKSSEGRIPSGIYALDERIRGGLGSGETGVIISPPKHGKTTALISFASDNVLKGHKVLYVTLELSRKIIASKFDVNMFGDSLATIKMKPKSYRSKLEELMKTVKDGHLNIVEFPTKSLTTSKFRELIDRTKPSICYLDYATLLKSSRDRNDRRFEITELHESLRSIAGQCKIPIWTAHQANRPSLDKKRIGMENIAEDFNIGAICDVLISLNQSEEEKAQGILKIYIAGNRLGPWGDIIECRSNWETSKIESSWNERDKENDKS